MTTSGVEREKTIFNCPQHRDEAIQEFEKGVHAISSSPIGKGAHAAKELSEAVALGVANYFIGYTGITYLENQDLTLAQKFIPVATSIVAGATKLPAVATAFVGGGVWGPGIMICSSLASLIQGGGQMYAEQCQISNIKKEFISKDHLQKHIDKEFKDKKDADKKKHVETYAFGPKDIFNLFYQLRQELIKERQISREKKVQTIEWINRMTEFFADQQTLPYHEQHEFNVTSLQINNEIKEKFPHICIPLIEKINEYNAAWNTMKNIKLSDISLPGLNCVKPKLKKFKLTQAKSYSQDLPIKAKDTYEKMLTGGKLDDDELKLFIATSANYRVNAKSLDQVIVLDDNYRLKVESHFKEDQKINIVEDYYHLPRKIYDSLWELKSTLSEFTFKTEQDKIHYQTNFDTMVGNYIATAELTDDNVKTINETATLLGKSFPDFQKTLQNSKLAFNDTIKDLPDTDSFKNEITQHQITTLQQYAFGLETHFDAANIIFDNNQNDLIACAQRVFKNSTIGSKILDASDKFITHVNKFEKAVDKKITIDIRGQEAYDRIQKNKAAPEALKKDRERVKDELESDQSTMFTLLDKKEHMETLQSIQGQRAAGLLINTASTLVSTASTVTMAAGAIPAGQASLIATLVFSATSNFLNLVSAGNNIIISQRISKQEKKMADIKSALVEGLAPDVQYDEKELQKEKKPGILTQLTTTLRRSARIANLKDKSSSKTATKDETVTAEKAADSPAKATI